MPVLTFDQLVTLKFSKKVRLPGSNEAYHHVELVKRYFQLIAAQSFQPEIDIRMAGKSRVIMEVGYTEAAAHSIVNRLDAILVSSKLLDGIAGRLTAQAPKGIISRIVSLFDRLRFGKMVVSKNLLLQAKRVYMKTVKKAVKELFACPYWTPEVKRVSRSTLCDFRALAIHAFKAGKVEIQREKEVIIPSGIATSPEPPAPPAPPPMPPLNLQPPKTDRTFQLRSRIPRPKPVLKSGQIRDAILTEIKTEGKTRLRKTVKIQQTPIPSPLTGAFASIVIRRFVIEDSPTPSNSSSSSWQSI